MALTELIVTQFIENQLNKTSERNGSRRKGKKRNGENEHILKHPKCNKHDRQLCQKVLPSLIEVANNFDKFISESSKEERFTDLTTPLLPHLIGTKQGSKQQCYDAFSRIADELFSDDVTWGRIVTFLVYAGELATKVTQQTEDASKIPTTISMIIENICKYFDEKLLQWIEQQDNGWMSIIAYQNEIQSDEGKGLLANGHSAESADESNNTRCMRQVISVAAFAAIIGGLYMCSKLSVQ